MWDTRISKGLPGDRVLPIEPFLPLPTPLEPRTIARPSVAIVIPVFNEAKVLSRTHLEIAKALDALAVDGSIIFVNDGSRDETLSVLESLFRSDPRVSYLVLSRNFGHQAALGAGLDHAKADVVISMDGDLQHPPELLGALVDAWRAGYDVVHTRKLATRGLSLGRSLVTRIAYRLVAAISSAPIIAHASDFRLLDRQAVAVLRDLRETARLYRGLTPWLCFRQCVLPFEAGERAEGTSQYGLGQLFRLFTRALFDFSSTPLQVGLVLGAIGIALSALYVIFILVWFVVGQKTPPGWASSMSMTLFLGSINLAFSGIVGVYVARIYDEVRARPRYIVARVREHEEKKASPPPAA